MHKERNKYRRKKTNCRYIEEWERLSKKKNEREDEINVYIGTHTHHTHSYLDLKFELEGWKVERSGKWDIGAAQSNYMASIHI